MSLVQEESNRLWNWTRVSHQIGSRKPRACSNRRVARRSSAVTGYSACWGKGRLVASTSHSTKSLKRQVAIKEPNPERFQHPGDAEVYLVEARTAATLDHPNLVPVYDVGRTAEGSVYVVSKFIEGRTLADLIDDEPTAEEASRLVAAVARALDHAHGKRLIHRDVKPANILIEDTTGIPYVADFGLAISEEASLNERNIAGTPAYMSPEQVRGEGHRLDGRSDIFSLGVILYELLTGKRPFRGSTMMEIFHQVTSADPPPPRAFDEAIPAELERICLKALAKRGVGSLRQGV